MVYNTIKLQTLHQENHFGSRMNKRENNSQRITSTFQQNKKSRSFKWLSYYKPTVDLNDPQYHIIAEPQDNKYQKVSIRNMENSRPITTFLEIQNYNQLKKFNENYKKQDHSKLKSFSFLDHIEKQPQQIMLNRQQTLRGSQWSRKYEPKAFYELLTEEVHNRNVLTWLKSWDGIVFGRQAPKITSVTSVKSFPKPFAMGNQNNNNYSNNRNNNTYQNHNEYSHSRLILLSGPPGCGKTTLARTVARHCGYQVVELNASDDRSGKVLIQKIQSLGKNNSVLNNKPTMIIIDQVDGALQQDGNGIKQVLNYIQYGNKSGQQKNTHKSSNPPKPTDLPKSQAPHVQKHSIIPRPIIFICNDPFAKGLRDLRTKAIVLYFRQVEKQKIVRRLKQITEKQKFYVENQVLNKIAQLCNCDIRSSLSILEYVCQFQRSSGQSPKDLINRLKLSFSKDSNQSILEYLSGIMNLSKRSQLKQMINLREFSYNFSKNQNPSLLLQGLFHNFIQYKHFFNRKTKESLHIYDLLKWSDVLLQQSFKYQNQTDHYLMMIFLYYRTFMVQQDMKKIEFPSIFFQKLNRQKLHKETVHQLVNSWPAFLQSTVSNSNVVKDYLYVLYYSVQTSSLKDTDIFDCVSKMITYGIQLGSRNSPFLFKPEFDSLLTFGQNKLEVLYSNISRTYIEESYAFAKLKSNLIGDISLADFNKNTEELLSQLNIKCRRRKRNCQTAIKNSIKYQFIEGSGTQITYDLKFSYFFA